MSGLGRVLLGILCTVLAVTAVAKLVHIGEVVRAPSLVAAVLECLLVVLLIRRRTRRPAAVATAAGFTGAAIVTAWISMNTSFQTACGCLGAVPTPQGAVLVLQGVVILCSTFVSGGADRC